MVGSLIARPKWSISSVTIYPGSAGTAYEVWDCSQHSGHWRNLKHQVQDWQELTYTCPTACCHLEPSLEQGFLGAEVAWSCHMHVPKLWPPYLLDTKEPSLVMNLTPLAPPTYKLSAVAKGACHHTTANGTLPNRLEHPCSPVTF